MLLPPPPNDVLVKLTAVVDEPLHNVWLATALTEAVGFTVIVNIIVCPKHPSPTDGETLIVAVIGDRPVLIAVNDGILPLPLAAIPTEGLLLVHVYSTALTGLPKIIALFEDPLHKTLLGIWFAVGIGSTKIPKVLGVPIHPDGLCGVTVIFATIAFV